MGFRRLLLMTATVLVLAVAVQPSQAYVAYDSHIVFLRTITGDLMKLLPRAMGGYIYQNRYDFLRGMTVMTRSIKVGPLKILDLEEIKRDAYARLSRDIPYCVEAFKGGELKLDSSPGNLAGRLGMIAYSIALLNMPAFPDMEHLENFSMALDTMVGERLVDIWVYYDGYGNFCSLGELLERLKDSQMPEFRYIRNKQYPVRMREDIYAMFRAPDKLSTQMLLTDVDINEIYNETINDILDVFVYIWKCSGMELAHPSYTAPPGTSIKRVSARRTVRGTPPAAMMPRRAPIIETVPPPAEAPPPEEAEPAPPPGPPSGG